MNWPLGPMLSILIWASCPIPSLRRGRVLNQLSPQRCLEEEYTGAPQPSEATLQPTLAGEALSRPQSAQPPVPAPLLYTHPGRAGPRVSDRPLPQS